MPYGATFEIPAAWEGFYAGHEQLKDVKQGKGEWYREYGKVANAALPFDHCSVQTGTYRWGAPTVAGVTVRGYAFDASTEVIEARIAKRGLSAAKSLPSATVRNASIARTDETTWRRLSITYDVWYFDYGGKASVDFYLTTKDGKTIVLVFMHAGMDTNNSIRQVLQSFTWG